MLPPYLFHLVPNNSPTTIWTQRVQQSPWSEAKVHSTSAQSWITSSIQVVPSCPTFVYRKIHRILNPTGHYAVDSFLLISFTSGTTRTGGGSSQSEDYGLHKAAGYFYPSGLLSGCRRYGGLRVEKSSEGVGEIVGQICARVSTSCGDLEARVLAFLAVRSG